MSSWNTISRFKKTCSSVIMCQKCFLTRLRDLFLHFYIQAHVQISILTMVMEQKSLFMTWWQPQSMVTVQIQNNAVESYRTCNSALLEYNLR